MLEDSEAQPSPPKEAALAPLAKGADSVRRLASLALNAWLLKDTYAEMGKDKERGPHTPELYTSVCSKLVTIAHQHPNSEKHFPADGKIELILKDEKFDGNKEVTLSCLIGESRSRIPQAELGSIRLFDPGWGMSQFDVYLQPKIIKDSTGEDLSSEDIRALTLSERVDIGTAKRLDAWLNSVAAAAGIEL